MNGNVMSSCSLWFTLDSGGKSPSLPRIQREQNVVLKHNWSAFRGRQKLVLHLWSSPWNYWPNNKRECHRGVLFSADEKKKSICSRSFHLFCLRLVQALSHTDSHSSRDKTQQLHTHTGVKKHTCVETFPRLINLEVANLVTIIIYIVEVLTMATLTLYVLSVM